MLINLQTFWSSCCNLSYSFTALFPFTEEAWSTEFQALEMLLSCWARMACASCQSSLFVIRTRGQQGAAPSVVVAYGGEQMPSGRNWLIMSWHKVRVVSVTSSQYLLTPVLISQSAFGKVSGCALHTDK